MTLSLLLDEHISPIVAEQIVLKRPQVEVFSLQYWQEGRFLGLDDELVLEAAAQTSLSLVTYDQNTISPILARWGEANITHGGVIFIDYRTIAPYNFGQLVHSLLWLWDTQGETDWNNRLIYLPSQTS